MVIASPNSSAFAAALDWLQGTLLGTLATAVAIVAVAFIGFWMLTGRMDIRRAAQVIIGCFILFGASTIANGILLAVSGTNEGPGVVEVSPPPPPQYPAPAASQQGSSSPFDPYAGAAVQQH